MFIYSTYKFILNCFIIVFGMTALYGPWPSLDFLTTGFLLGVGGLSTPHPASNLEDQASLFVTPEPG
jgi:hypothetical protein